MESVGTVRTNSDQHMGVGDGEAVSGASQRTSRTMRRVTRRQALAATAASLLTLGPGVLAVDAEGDSGASTPGMNMNASPTPGADGMNMAPVDGGNAPSADPNARGNQLLAATVVDGVHEYRLTASVIKWNILPNVVVTAYAYNGQVPGPLLRFTAGDPVRVIVANDLPEPTSVHWHGLAVPNNMDGVAGVTQAGIKPGESFTYEFTVPATPGTYFYHSHEDADRQQPLGLYGALIIDPKDPAEPSPYNQECIVELGEWRVTDGKTYPAMDFDGMLPNYFTINGKSYPSTETIKAGVGDHLLFRFIGTGQFIHPMHIHGGPFHIVATDGNPVPPEAQLIKDTVLIGPGERYDVVWAAQQPGKWLLHCHILHHTTNDGMEEQGGGGLTMVIDVS